ncbi:MAG: hypothetical protein A2Y21_06300 [Clostridiales bacterium GWC2_40_7]|nr:MAG: hypothetical protein A2Y21_06300 [Clostridiales bacterium GWC2_40_7]
MFNGIKQQLDRTYTERQKEIQKQEQYEELQSVLKEKFFMDLVLGALRNKDEINNRIKALDLKINLQNSRCCIVNAIMEDFEIFLSDKWEYGREGLYNAIRNFVSTVEAEISFYPFRNSKDSIQFLTFSHKFNDRERFSQDLKKCLETVRMGIKDFFCLQIRFETGKQFNSIFELSTDTSLLSSFVPGQGSETHTNAGMVELSNLAEHTKLLFTHILTCNYQLSKSLFDHFIEEYKQLDIKDIGVFITHLFALLYNKFLSCGIKSDMLEIDASFYNEIQNLGNMCEAKEWGGNKLKKVIDEVVKQGNVSEWNVITRVKHYVRANYNSDITLENIADHVYLNPVYLSRFFKEQTGENYIDYLVRIRMEKAVELMQDFRLKIHEISRMVGYESVKYFYIVFKRYAGQTPTEYRKKTYGEGYSEADG